tara:strand:- start:2563 stop:3363 length:801 start_codon:yes stop_codon:yes gene_type:complete
MIIDPNLRREIEQKRDYVRGSPEKVLARAQRLKKALEQEANAHSLRIEHPNMVLRYASSEEPHKAQLRKFIRKVKENMTEAWSFALGSYNGEISEEMVLEIASRVDPELFHGRANYRRDGVRFDGTHLLAPRPEKVPAEMYGLVERVNSMQDPLEKALYAHFNVARIQPVADTNKRTARTLQNAILHKEGYVPATVLEGERNVYYDLFLEAVQGYKNRDKSEPISPGEVRFYNFLASKVNISLDHVLDRITEGNTGRFSSRNYPRK